MFIPNFSRLSNVFITMLFTQLVVSVYWLLVDPSLSFVSLGLWALYALWVVLLTFVGIHFAKPFLNELALWQAYFFILSVALLALIFVEVGVAYYQSAGTNLLPDANRLIRFSIAYFLLVLMLLRAFHFIGHFKNLDRAESDSRIAALQARIQPHFLFNSLNTIAELTATSPAKAESAIESLSMLFRVSLEDAKNRHSLQKEITLCERYSKLESYRIEGELVIDWSVSVAEPARWLIPKLLLQPIIENAIKYSPKVNSTKNVILVSIKESSTALSFKVENEIANHADTITGNGIALQNIKDRLSVLYDDKQSLKEMVRDGRYQVLIKLPKLA